MDSPLPRSSRSGASLSFGVLFEPFCWPSSQHRLPFGGCIPYATTSCVIVKPMIDDSIARQDDPRHRFSTVHLRYRTVRRGILAAKQSALPSTSVPVMGQGDSLRITHGRLNPQILASAPPLNEIVLDPEEIENAAHCVVDDLALEQAASQRPRSRSPAQGVSRARGARVSLEGEGPTGGVP